MSDQGWHGNPVLVASSGHSRSGHIQHPSHSVNCCCFTSFVLSLLRWHQKGGAESQRPAKSPSSSKLGSFAIDKSPQSCFKAARKREGIVVCFPAAFISVSIKTVKQNAQNDIQKPNKVMWADSFSQTQCVHYPEVWSRLCLGHIFFQVTDNWMRCEVTAPLLLKLAPYWITN